MSRFIIMTLILPAGVLVAGCNGGDGDNKDPVAVISAENTLSYGQKATTSLTGMADAGEELSATMALFSMMSAGKTGPEALQKLAATATEETIACAGGGTVSVESNTSGTEQTVSYVADQCKDESGVTLHGELHVAVGPWDEFPQGTAFEMVMETGQSGLAAGECEFNGGFVMRFHAAESPDEYGENTFIFEYGTTGDGFISFCAPDHETNIAANTLVRNEFTFAYTEGGGMTSSNTVSIHGGFEAPDGSGYVTIVAEDLEYGVTENGDSLYGVSSCPSSGQLTLTGGNDSTASVYFGDDAPPGYAVQVIGPDGYVAEFETCEDFLAAAE